MREKNPQEVEMLTEDAEDATSAKSSPRPFRDTGGETDQVAFPAGLRAMHSEGSDPLPDSDSSDFGESEFQLPAPRIGARIPKFSKPIVVRESQSYRGVSPRGDSAFEAALLASLIAEIRDVIEEITGGLRFDQQLSFELTRALRKKLWIHGDPQGSRQRVADETGMDLLRFYVSGYVDLSRADLMKLVRRRTAGSLARTCRQIDTWAVGTYVEKGKVSAIIATGTALTGEEPAVGSQAPAEIAQSVGWHLEDGLDSERFAIPGLSEGE
jgi:hypothetical protein